MIARPLTIVGSGMVTGVGLNAMSSCAAVRCAMDNFQETRFMGSNGDWIIGSSVPLGQSCHGIAKLSDMLVHVIKECISTNSQFVLDQVPLLLCVAEKDRPGRLQDLNTKLLLDAQDKLGVCFHRLSAIIDQGRVSIAVALKYAQQLLYEEKCPAVMIAGVDSLLVGESLRNYGEKERILNKQNSNGFIPGEAAAAILVQASEMNQEPQLLCRGIGYGNEKSTIDSEDIPSRADGLVQAMRGALSEAGCDMGATDFRICDVSGELYSFKEAATALLRVLRQRKVFYDLWHPADCIGEVGAAIGPVMLGVLLHAMREGYSPGNNVMAHVGNDDGRRAAMILSYETAGGR